MAIRKGWDGGIYVGSTSASTEVLHMNSWAMNISGDALEKSAFGSKDRLYDPGLRGITVDFAGYYESTSVSQKYILDRMKANSTNASYGVRCLYQRSPARGFSGKGVVTSITVGGPVDGLVPFSGSIQVSGGMSTV
jgi:hypothetical protein